ncbi:hypothetical protein K0M31_012287 [Melipona bicolor]|uniref:Uncharacterized protein n=1 Tax=Melipona bicolor TaxID=60889 RepID=A0AA40KHM6_9HYME|nr:hypothetical protein K0M31_012287 [Melipona bicolor]
MYIRDCVCMCACAYESRNVYNCDVVHASSANLCVYVPKEFDEGHDEKLNSLRSFENLQACASSAQDKRHVQVTVATSTIHSEFKATIPWGTNPWIVDSSVDSSCIFS